MEGKRLALNAAWCKGCGICVAFCPKQALVIENGRAALPDPALCIVCGQCELRCPDYAIYVEQGEEAISNG